MSGSFFDIPPGAVHGQTLGGADPLALGGITPTLPSLELDEAAWMLQGLYLVNRQQLRKGVPGINQALIDGRIKYIRSDKAELWQPIRTIYLNGGGDCEDLAAAVAAEIASHGIEARPVIYRVRPGLAHAVVQLEDPRYKRIPKGTIVFGHPVIAPGIIDPSRTGGMGRE